MKLLYSIMQDGNYLVEISGQEVRLLASEADVTTAYGFESPEPDNRWIFEHCGIRVYRKCIYFAGEYCVAVFEPIGSMIPNSGYSWMEEAQLTNLATEQADALLFAKNSGQSKTAPWMGNHGIAVHLSWAKAVLAEQKCYICGTVQQIKNAYVSSIFLIPTDAGNFYLKITSSVYVNTAGMEQQLTEQMGGVPGFVAVSPDGYAAITKEMSGRDGVGGTVEQYRSWLEVWGEQQAKTVGENHYGLADCSAQKLWANISDFEKQVEHIFAFTKRPLSEQDRNLLHSKLKKVKSDLALLCSYPVPNAVCHADIRPGNMRIMGGKEVLYDWGMAFYGHPFYDALHFLHVVRRQLTEEQKKEIVDAYLSKWTAYGDMETLRDVYAQAERCKEYFMLAADCRWVAEILSVCGDIPPKGTIDHWLLGKRFYYFDRVLNRFLSD